MSNMFYGAIFAKMLNGSKALAIFEEKLPMLDRSSPSAVFFGKATLKICSKCTGEHPCQSVISIKLQSK